MLSLGLNVGESILIGQNIRVMYVMPTGGGQIRLAIDAPRSVPVDREVVRASKLRDGTLKADCSEISGTVDAGGTVHSDADPGL